MMVNRKLDGAVDKFLAEQLIDIIINSTRL